MRHVDITVSGGPVVQLPTAFGEFPAYGGNEWAGNTWADGQPARLDTSR